MRCALGRLLLLTALVLLGGWDAPTRPDPDVAAGNRAFAAGDYQAALRAYERAFAGGGDRARLHFDTGTALYELARTAEEGPRETLLERAETAFRRAAVSAEPAIAVAAYYNLGNVLFQRGQLEDAIGAYRRALRLDPDHDDARHNLELALRRRPEPPASGPQRGGDGPPSAPAEGGDGAPGQGEGAAAEGEGAAAEGAPGAGEEADADGDAPSGDGGGEGPVGEQPGEGDGDGRDTEAPPEPAPERAPEPPRERPPSGDARPGPGRSGAGASDTERKLRELERRSRELRRQQLQRGSRDLDPSRLQPRRDW